jgi:nicotinamide-nucleotide amidase
MTLGDQMNRLATDVVAQLSAQGIMLATAESCTAGLIAATVADIPGASSVLERGFVTYSNEAKQEMLGVSAATLEAVGAVSAQTATEMASGALNRSRAQVAVSVTGIAGPGGGTIEKPVGLVHFSCATKTRQLDREQRFGALSREEIRQKSVICALELVLEITR